MIVSLNRRLYTRYHTKQIRLGRDANPDPHEQLLLLTTTPSGLFVNINKHNFNSRIIMDCVTVCVILNNIFYHFFIITIKLSSLMETTVIGRDYDATFKIIARCSEIILHHTRKILREIRCNCISLI